MDYGRKEERQMQGLRLCSKQSIVPYYVAALESNIYSIEELAYYLYNHAYFVEESFFSDGLVDYIDQHLHMPKLAAKMRLLLEKKNMLKELILSVIDASGYYDEEEKIDFARKLDELFQKSEIERMKLKADYLYGKEHYSLAEQFYQNVLEQERVSYGKDFYASIYFNLGKIKMKRFLFQEGKEYFAKAYGYCQDEKIAKAFVSSILLMLDYEGESKETLLLMVKERIGMVELSESLIIEMIENLKKSVLRCEMTSEYENIDAVIKGLNQNHLENYYQGMQDVVELWKKEYRQQFKES